MEQPTAGPLVYVIEDDTAIGRLVRLILGSVGFTVHQETTAATGLAAVAEQEPDAILLDLTLPDSTGADLIPELAHRTRAPIIVLTGAAGDELTACLTAGAFDVLLKPFDPDDLEASVAAATRTAQAMAVQAELTAALRPSLVDPDATLSWTEQRILRFLASKASLPALHQELCSQLWGRPLRNQLDILQAWIERLQTKVRITEFHGVGFALSPADRC